MSRSMQQCLHIGHAQSWLIFGRLQVKLRTWLLCLTISSSVSWSSLRPWQLLQFPVDLHRLPQQVEPFPETFRISIMDECRTEDPHLEVQDYGRPWRRNADRAAIVDYNPFLIRTFALSNGVTAYSYRNRLNLILLFVPLVSRLCIWYCNQDGSSEYPNKDTEVCCILPATTSGCSLHSHIHVLAWSSRCVGRILILAL